MEQQIHLTVATVVEKSGKYLTVFERDSEKLIYNQPAGHVEPGEKITVAAIRETLEETGWLVKLTSILSLSTYLAPGNGETYYRICFAAEPVKHNPDSPLDTDIIEADWLTPEELMAHKAQPRSPLVHQAIIDHQSGIRYPLTLLREPPDHSQLESKPVL